MPTPFEDFQHRITRLDSGLTVATVAIPHMTSVSVGLWAGAGSRHETAAVNGAAHFIEHMLFKGTRRRNPLEISQAIEGVGGYLNAFTSEENTCFYARACHERVATMIEVLADMYTHSRFQPEDIRKEREVIKEEVAQYNDDPTQRVLEMLNGIQWPGQPLGRPITGTVRTLNRLGRGELLAFQREHYAADNTLLCAAGRLSHQQVLRNFKPYSRWFRPGLKRAMAPVKERRKGPVARRLWRDTEQTHIALGFRTCSRHDPRRYALRLLNVILGENMSSRLFQELREDAGLAYAIHSSVSFFHDTGDLVIAAGLDSAKLPRALRMIRRELQRLADHPPAPRELERARDYVLGQFELGLENTETQMMNLGEQWLGWGRIFTPAEVRQRLRRVAADEISAAARAFFQPERCCLATVGPVKDVTPLIGIFA